MKGVAVGTRAGSIQWSAWDELVEISKLAKSLPSSIVTKGHFGMVLTPTWLNLQRERRTKETARARDPDRETDTHIDIYRYAETEKERDSEAEIAECRCGACRWL